jgi:Flp pilus assembly protein TadG
VILPLVVAVMFGAIEAGRMVVSRAMLSYASINGVRTAAVSGTASLSDVQNTVISSAPMLALTASNITVSIDGATTSSAFLARTAGDDVSVTVTYTFQPMVSLPAGLTTRTWTATTQAVVE